MTVIKILIGSLDIVTKGLVQGLEDLEIRGRAETIQTTALLSLNRAQETLGDNPVTSHQLTLV